MSVAQWLSAACAALSCFALPAQASDWVPSTSDSWQLQLQGTIDTQYPVTVYDIDLFDTPDAVFAQLHARGAYVVCYFSAGSAEKWRADYGDFQIKDLGRKLDGWPGERWVDTRSANVRRIMKRRLDLAAQRGCDGVDPDNVDGYSNKTGLPLTAETQLNYNRFLAREARARGLRVGLKNDVGQLAQLAKHFDFAVNEQCHVYHECDGYRAFTDAGKPVFNVEYKRLWLTDPVAREAMCADSRARNMRTLVSTMALDGSVRISCDE